MSVEVSRDRRGKILRMRAQAVSHVAVVHSPYHSQWCVLHQSGVPARCAKRCAYGWLRKLNGSLI
jgi:hypothetical protein